MKTSSACKETTVTYDEFDKTLKGQAPNAGIEGVLEALWYEKNGDWDKAHRTVQEIPSSIGSAVHAYLHRREGDIGNARYWYGRADRKEFRGPLDEEWEALAKEITGE